ncbi:unnamed protein product [Aureobasidium pullulans]|nr:unnamed protein product [Aureobasidium pullulans]
MKFSAVFVGAFAALAAAQGSQISSAVSSVASSAISSGSSAASSAVSSATERSSSSASAGSSASSSGASATSSSQSTSTRDSDSDSDSMTTTSIHTTTIFYQYPNTFHKPGQTSSYSLPSGASTFDVTVSNVTTTYTSTNTFHGAVSKSWLVTTSYETTMGLPTSTQSEGSAAKLGVGAFGAFALGAAALL